MKFNSEMANYFRLDKCLLVAIFGVKIGLKFGVDIVNAKIHHLTKLQCSRSNNIKHLINVQ